MSDLPVEGTVVDRKEVPLTVEERLERAEKDIVELARGVNTQGALLESIVVALDSVVKRYLALTRVPEKKSEETPSK